MDVALYELCSPKVFNNVYASFLSVCLCLLLIRTSSSFAEIPKIRQLESLRPFLIEYDLFDPKRDPETALIGLHVRPLRSAFVYIHANLPFTCDTILPTGTQATCTQMESSSRQEFLEG